MLAAAVQSDAVDYWSTRDLSFIGGGEKYARTRAICAAVSDAQPAAADIPSPSERKALEGCDSEALYFGFGVPMDRAKARKCAVAERGHTEYTLALHHGAGLLAMAYANGEGGPKNLAVAIHMACQMEDAPAAMDARIEHLDDIRSGKAEGGSFDTCDDITSGASGGVCAQFAARRSQQDRQPEIARLKRGWTDAQAEAFDRAYEAFRAYADAEHEMDCFRGTAQAACNISGREYEIERFLDRIAALKVGAPFAKDDEQELGIPNPAINPTAWRKMVADMDSDTRAFYERNRDEILDKRATFERALVRFVTSTFPAMTAHETRVRFSDL
ncbi:hypothetical protein F7D01_00590 [Erythrobacter sp. 3-20A1M]|uniref:hypothetical protein n=1 Tax=Erythrobacter sp. 3-20A1M TaxID=2653850 RepID=UPI001BFCA7D1|nr:hypothetical protein [Erythrobacter sp. 3-20A1M]QWC55780.1 hypothetical protein F7D01_00590 [Erythrobacter sp. 3-20A1M]